MLNNKTILVVGAAGLLGTSTVCALLENHANVIAADIDIVLMRSKFESMGISEGNRLMLKEINVTNELDMVAFFDEIEHLDGAVNLTYPRNKNYGRHFFDVSFADFNENLAFSGKTKNHFR